MKDNTFVCDDCLQAMTFVPDGYVDLIFCDLPYGTTQAKVDTPIDLDSLWIQYKRVLKPDGAVVLFSHGVFTFDLVYSNREWYKYKWIWVKNKSTNHLNAKKMPLRQYEELLVFYNNPPTYNPQMSDGHKPMNYAMGGMSNIYGDERPTPNDAGTTLRYPKDVLYFDVVNNDDPERIHPFQKPVDLCRYIIRTYTNENDVVLDNAAGSGSILVAANQEKRRFIGVEIDKEVFDKAKERVDGRSTNR